jgi:ribosomal protein L22
VRTEYLKQIEDYKAELSRRSNAVEVAEVLADFFYASAPKKKELMTKVWKLSVSLPPEIVKNMASAIADAENNQTNPKELLVKARKLIHGAGDDVTAENLLHML